MEDNLERRMEPSLYSRMWTREAARRESCGIVGVIPGNEGSLKCGEMVILEYAAL